MDLGHDGAPPQLQELQLLLSPLEARMGLAAV
jgi:hypothetical protein